MDFYLCKNHPANIPILLMSLVDYLLDVTILNKVYVWISNH
jgi:hypothetical protein